MATDVSEFSAKDKGTAIGEYKDQGNSQELPRQDTYAEIMKRKKEQLHEIIQRCQENKNYDTLLSTLTKAIHLYPGDLSYFVLRADAYTEMSDFSSAIVNLRHVWRTDKDDAEIRGKLLSAYTQRGHALYNSQLYQESMDAFWKARELDPDSLSLQMKCMDCLRELEEFDKCMSLIQQCLGKHPGNPHLLVLRARMNILFGKKSLAYEDLIQSLEQDPTHTEAQSLLASLQTEASLKREEAVRLRFAGNKEEAVKQITSAIETNPSVPEYNVFRGSLYRQMDMYNKAQSDFHTAVHKCGRSADHPVHRLAMKQLALTYNDVAVEHFRRRRFKEAMRLLNQAIDIEKTEKVLYSNRGDCFYRMREYHFAQSDYEQALELVPEDWGMRTRLAVVYCDIGVEEHRGHKSTQALKHFDLAIQSNPKVSRFYTCRAAVKHAMNDAPGAQRDCIFALLLDPDNQDTQSILARVFPGQSAHEVLKSARADRTRRELETMIAQSATVTKPMPSLLPQEAKNRDSVYGIDLKVIDSSELEEFTNNPADNVSEDEELGRLFGGDVDSSGDLPHTEDVPSYSAGEDTMLSPRARELIAKPLPPIPSTGAGVMPDLKSCLKEAQFHSDMYYTKKESSESFRKFLCKPQQISPALPNIGIPQDVKFGQHRTITPIPRDLTTK